MSENLALILGIAAALVGALAVAIEVRRRRRLDDDNHPVRTAAERSRSPRGTQPPPPTQNVVVFAQEPLATQFTQAVDGTCTVAKTPAELTKALASGKPAALFVDVGMLGQLGKADHDLPVVAILDETPSTGPSAVVNALLQHHSVKHVLARPLLTAPIGKVHIKRLINRLGGSAEHDVLDSASIGRVAMLAKASHRNQRFDRMQAYFSKAGVTERTIGLIYEVAEELVMNALYNAPTEAGFFKQPVSRSEDVTLPIDRACEISYGLEGDNAFVRLRDTFGALRHERLLEVLERCAKDAVALDESRGGAGLGMWRVFTIANTISITVVQGRLTDIVVRIATKGPKRGKQLLAADLFFINTSQTQVKLREPEDKDELEQSVALIT